MTIDMIERRVLRAIWSDGVASVVQWILRRAACRYNALREADALELIRRVNAGQRDDDLHVQLLALHDEIGLVALRELWSRTQWQ